MVILDTVEEDLISRVMAYLREHSPDEASLAEERLSCLRNFGAAISCFPSVRKSQELRGGLRVKGGIIASLGNFSPSARLLHTPTRIVATRGFLVAKTHAFSLLLMLTTEKPEFRKPLGRTIFSIICTLIAEDVYISCLDDPDFNDEKKDVLAEDLISLWDSGTDPRSIHHIPSLQALWAARHGAPPCFGTMDGSSELVRVSIDLDEDWQSFILDGISRDETRWALEEFLFGLSYEEIQEVRTRLKRFKVNAVDHEEVRSYLGRNPSFTMVKKNDPRGIYDFYVDRRDSAYFRAHTKSPGPKNTLEGLYLKYRIAAE
ncbi:hypothetical protein [Breznakiella homolactica]|nr:hypothetical protein [Breznakiella homolactica]